MGELEIVKLKRNLKEGDIVTKDLIKAISDAIELITMLFMEIDDLKDEYDIEDDEDDDYDD